MGNLLDRFTVDSLYKNEELNRDSFGFLELTGRKALHSQGIYGQGVVIAVVDTGVSPHPEFEDRLLEGYNAIEKYGNRSWHDDNMHGTHVAGSIVGKTCGVAPKAEILPIKVLTATGGGEWKDVIKGIDFARTWRQGTKKVNIISMSLSGGSRDMTATERTNLETAINKCVEAGILVVVSAGNTAKDELRYPAAFENVVTVGALDWDKKLAKYSTYGNHVDLVQIGTGVISAYYDGEYAELSGTSMSTPIISGIAALLICAHKQRLGEDITERKLYEALKMHTKDLGVKGVDKYFGAGFCTLQPLNSKIKVVDKSRTMYVNDQPLEMDVPAYIENGRFLISIRYLAEALGGKVAFTPKTGAENEVTATIEL